MVEDKILEGYFYRNAPFKDGHNLQLSTGSGGALNLIKAYKDEGLSDEAIEEIIGVLVDINTWVRLSMLEVKEKIK